MEFIREYLANIVAGLIPALVVFGQSVYLIIKNFKVNKNVEELFDIAKGLKLDSLDLELTMKKAAPLVKELLDDFREEFDKEKNKLVDELTKSFNQTKSELTNAFNEQQKVFQEQIRRLRAENQRLKLKEGESDVHPL